MVFTRRKTMLRSMFTAITSLNIYQSYMDVVADNLSNANTPGFKSSRVTFMDQIAQLLSMGSAPTDTLGGIKGIEEAYLFGSYASNKMDSSSDIDILTIGTHSILELQRIIVKLQKDTGREFNVTNLNPKEFEAKKKDKNHFINSVFKARTIRLI